MKFHQNAQSKIWWATDGKKSYQRTLITRSRPNAIKRKKEYLDRGFKGTFIRKVTIVGEHWEVYVPRN